jgi:hypothetical protein
MYNYALLYIIVKYARIMSIIFVSKIAKSGTDVNGNERRIIIIPIDKSKEITKFHGKQVKITIDEI